MHPPATDASAALLIHRALKSTAVFGAWDEDVLQQVVQISRLRRHAKGCALMAPMRTWCELLVVVAGSVEISRTSLDGSKFVLNIVHAGDCVGFARLLPNSSVPYDHVAFEDALVVHIRGESFLQLLDREPILWRSIALLALEKQREKIASLQHRALSVFPEQLARLLINCAASSSTIGGGAGQLHIPLNQTELGAMLGVSRQTVNKELGRLSSRHIVEVRYGNIKILDLPALQALSERWQPSAVARSATPHQP